MIHQGGQAHWTSSRLLRRVGTVASRSTRTITLVVASGIGRIFVLDSWRSAALGWRSWRATARVRIAIRIGWRESGAMVVFVKASSAADIFWWRRIVACTRRVTSVGAFRLLRLGRVGLGASWGRRKWCTSRAGRARGTCHLRQRLAKCTKEWRTRSDTAGNGRNGHKSRCRCGTYRLEDALVACLAAVGADPIRSAITAATNLWLSRVSIRNKKDGVSRNTLAVGGKHLDTNLAASAITASYGCALARGCLSSVGGTGTGIIGSVGNGSGRRPESVVDVGILLSLGGLGRRWGWWVGTSTRLNVSPVLGLGIVPVVAGGLDRR